MCLKVSLVNKSQQSYTMRKKKTPLPSRFCLSAVPPVSAGLGGAP